MVSGSIGFYGCTGRGDCSDEGAQTKRLSWAYNMLSFCGNGLMSANRFAAVMQHFRFLYDLVGVAGTRKWYFGGIFGVSIDVLFLVDPVDVAYQR